MIKYDAIKLSRNHQNDTSIVQGSHVSAEWLNPLQFYTTRIVLIRIKQYYSYESRAQALQLIQLLHKSHTLIVSRSQTPYHTATRGRGLVSI